MLPSSAIAASDLYWECTLCHCTDHDHATTNDRKVDMRSRLDCNYKKIFDYYDALIDETENKSQDGFSRSPLFLLSTFFLIKSKIWVLLSNRQVYNYIYIYYLYSIRWMAWNKAQVPLLKSINIFVFQSSVQWIGQYCYRWLAGRDWIYTYLCDDGKKPPNSLLRMPSTQLKSCPWTKNNFIAIFLAISFRISQSMNVINSTVMKF